MCGIVGYVGPNRAADFLAEGLRRLEYRGYDSAGIVTLDSEQQLELTRSVGRIEQLTSAMAHATHDGSIGIGHTRWATHGGATVENAHPHLGGNDGRIAIVHNGVVENYQFLKAQLIEQGYEFHSATDSEVVAHLIASHLDDEQFADDPEQALLSAVSSAPWNVWLGRHRSVAARRDSDRPTR